MRIEQANNSVSAPTEKVVPRMESSKASSPASVSSDTVATVEISSNITSAQKTFGDVESLSDMRRKTKGELNMGEKDWIALIERANKAINGANKSFEYSIHEATKQIVVKIIDKDTHEVIREIPSEKILDMVAKMWELNGLFVDERR